MAALEYDKYTCGNATIDSSFSVKKADDDFYKFLGESAMYSLVRVIHPDDMYRLVQGISELDKTTNNVVALRMVRNDGQYRWVLMNLKYNSSISEENRLIDFGMEDITSFKDRVDQLKDDNDTYGEYFSLMEYFMLSYDITTDILKVFMMGKQQVDFYNGKLEEWRTHKLVQHDIAKNGAEAFNKLCDDIHNGVANFQYELNMKLVDDENKDWCLFKGKTIVDRVGKKHVIATISIINPVTKKQEANTSISSTRDAGTDLLNKRTITKYAMNLIDAKPTYAITIAIIDLDNFKYVNDKFGHMFGDEVLAKTAQIIKGAVGSRGVAGRIGGDEMFIVLENMSGEEEIRGVLRTIRANVEWAYKDKSDKLRLSCSIGCASYPNDADNYEELFSMADKTLYLAKEKGKNRYVIYKKNLHEKYIDGTGDVEVREEELYKYNKISVTNDIIRSFMQDEKYDLKGICEKVGLAFELDSIYIYKGPERIRTTLWGLDNKAENDGIYFDKDHYQSNFDSKRIFISDNTKFLEKRFDTAFHALTDMKICSSVQYYVGEYDNPSGFMSFNKSRFVQKWSEVDIAYLAILGQAMGMELIHDK